MIAIDYALAALWVLLLFRNKAAIVPLLLLLLDHLMWEYATNFIRCCITATLYFVLSSVNIRFSSDFRHALWFAGLLYFLGAFDELLYRWLGVSTLYYDAMPYLVIAVCAYMAAALFDKGGRDSVGNHWRYRRAFVSRFFRLQ